jgi:hypothetical protein
MLSAMRNENLQTADDSQIKLGGLYARSNDDARARVPDAPIVDGNAQPRHGEAAPLRFEQLLRVGRQSEPSGLTAWYRPDTI